MRPSLTDRLEIETLGPRTKLPPDGHVDHAEHWFLNRVQLGDTEASLDKQLMPLVRKTGK